MRAIRPDYIRFDTLGNKLQIFEILHKFCEVEVMLCEKIILEKNKCDLLPNMLKLMKCGAIVQNNEQQKILDYFPSAVIPFKSLSGINNKCEQTFSQEQFQ